MAGASKRFKPSGNVNQMDSDGRAMMGGNNTNGNGNTSRDRSLSLILSENKLGRVSSNTFKWFIGDFKSVCGKIAAINSQKANWVMAATPLQPEIIWTFSLCYFATPTYEEAVKISYEGRTRNSAMPAYTLQINVPNKNGPVYFSGLQDTGNGDCFLGTISSFLQPKPIEPFVIEVNVDVYRRYESDINFPVDCWNTYHISSKKTQLLDMLRTGHLSDVKIISNDGQEFLAHKLILRAGSEVFEAMFRHEMVESTNGVVNLEDISSRAVIFLLHFLYTSQLLPISPNVENTTATATGTGSGSDADNVNATIEEVLHLASKYELKELTEHLDHTMWNFCNEKNSWKLLKLCNLYELEHGKDMVFRYMMKNQPNELKNFVCSKF